MPTTRPGRSNAEWLLSERNCSWHRDSATDADKHMKYMARRDRALATIVLAVDPSLLYLIGDPEDPKVVWEKLSGQFQKKTWANKLSLRKRLVTMKLSDSGSMREYGKKMTEAFDEWQ